MKMTTSPGVGASAAEQGAGANGHGSSFHLDIEDGTHLTVWKTSLFFAGDGFSVFDSAGQLVFRVDFYGCPDSRDRDEIFLMDPAGHSLFTLRRKRPSLHHRWEGYLGERREESKPIFSVKRSSIIGRSGVTVEMYTNPGEEYHIEGSFHHRCCTVYHSGHAGGADQVQHDKEREVVAEIRRKVDLDANVVLGKDVFLLCIKTGFDAAFAMAMVLVLDQISGTGADRILDHVVGSDVYSPATNDESGRWTDGIK